MHLLVAAAFGIVINGTISVRVRDADSGENGAYVQRIRNARASISRGIHFRRIGVVTLFLRNW